MSAVSYGSSLSQAQILQQQQQQQQTNQTSLPQIDNICLQGVRLVADLRSAVRTDFKFLQRCRADRNVLRETTQEESQQNPCENLSSPEKQAYLRSLKNAFKELTDKYGRLEQLAAFLPDKYPGPVLNSKLASVLERDACQEPAYSDELSEKIQAFYIENKAIKEYNEYTSLFLRDAATGSKNTPEFLSPDKTMTMPPAHELRLLLQRLANQHGTPMEVIDASKTAPDITFALNLLASDPTSKQNPPQPQSPILMNFGVIIKNGFTQWVNVLSAEEFFVDFHGKYQIHRISRYEVFRKMSDHLNQVMLAKPVDPWFRAIQILFFRMNQYRRLWLDKCTRCGKILKDFLPAYQLEVEVHPRTNTRQMQAFHESCRIQS